MSRWLSSWRTALRIAGRESRRHKGRSALVIALIGLPVFALGFLAVNYDMFRLTPQEEITRDIGAADAWLRWESAGPVEQSPEGDGWSGEAGPRTAPYGEPELKEVFPRGRFIPYAHGVVDLRTATGIGAVNASSLDIADPMAAGILAVTEGTAPAGEGQIAVNRAAAERLGVGLGDAVTSSDGTTTWRVTAYVESAGRLSPLVVFHPDGQPESLSDDRWLVDTPTPVTWQEVRQLNEHGLLVGSRAVLLDPPPHSELTVSTENGADATEISLSVLIGGLCLLQIVLLAGPAFAVSARRRLRDLALVASNGGEPGHLRRLVLADGVLSGLVGAAIGLTLAVVAALAARPLVETYVMHTRAGGFRVFPLALLAIVGLAVLSGLLAALAPAMAAVRFDIVRALVGRRGTTGLRRRWPLIGAGLAAVAAAVIVSGALFTSISQILAGVVLLELGLVFCTPALITMIARLGSRMPVPLRIALRDTARNRGAAAPAVAAVMGAVAGAVAIGTFMISQEAQRIDTYLPALPEGYVAATIYSHPIPETDVDLTRLAETARANLPATAVAGVDAIACPPGSTATYCSLWPRFVDGPCPYGERPDADDRVAAMRDGRCDGSEYWQGPSLGSVVNDGSALPVLTGLPAADLAPALAVLRAGGMVTGDAGVVVDGKATISVSAGTESEITIPAYAMAGTHAPFTVFAPQAVAEAGLATRPYGVVVATSRAPSQAEDDAFAAAIRAISPDLDHTVERGPTSDDGFILILLAVAGLLVLGATTIATGLTAADGRADLGVLAAVGASPRLRRLLSLSQSAVISGLGTTLGLVAGLATTVAVLIALNQVVIASGPAAVLYPIDIPWTLTAALLAVPVLAMLTTGLLTRSRLPIERRLA